MGAATRKLPGTPTAAARRRQRQRRSLQAAGGVRLTLTYWAVLAGWGHQVAQPQMQPPTRLTSTAHAPRTRPPHACCMHLEASPSHALPLPNPHSPPPLPRSHASGAWVGGWGSEALLAPSVQRRFTKAMVRLAARCQFSKKECEFGPTSVPLPCTRPPARSLLPQALATRPSAALPKPFPPAGPQQADPANRLCLPLPASCRSPGVGVLQGPVRAVLRVAG